MTGVDAVVSKFYRELNIREAMSVVKFTAGDVAYKRSGFISYPDQVMVIRIKANKKGSLNFNTHIESELRYAITATDDDSLILKGKAPEYVAHRNEEPQQVVYAADGKGEGMKEVPGLEFEQQIDGCANITGISLNCHCFVCLKTRFIGFCV